MGALQTSTVIQSKPNMGLLRRRKSHTHTHTHIQGVREEKVSILAGDNGGHPEEKMSFRYASDSEWLPRYIRLNLFDI